MARHRQKDEEAGAEGCGILNTRKRMWKDADGKIVTKKPALNPDAPLSENQDQDPLSSLGEFVSFQPHDRGAPISPPISHDPSLHSAFDDHDSGIASGYPSTLDANTLSNSGSSYSPSSEQRFWSSNLTQNQPEPFLQVSNNFDDAPFDEIFNPDTASSFNNPFTTMSNYNWLFDMDLSRPDPMQAANMMADPFPSFQFDTNNVTVSHPMELQFDHMAPGVDRISVGGQVGSAPSLRTGSPQHMSPTPLISPPLTDEEPLPNRKPCDQTQQGPTGGGGVGRPQLPSITSSPPNVERPLSMLQPSRSLPIIDDLARQQLLDLIDITQPMGPDGSRVDRDHPLLSLSCLQTYCDLFFTRFNTAYPLIHMSTFDPSHVDTLLLTSVLLLGATYGEKDAHQLAVCIHDVLRPQIFANAGFSAKPELWVLQTILLVECFGKSRAGQKQHDMSHLFHGLLINLIRRSDCQTIRPPTLEDATDDLEVDWHTWVDAEQKKRLAFLCFMWDTQHAVLFCQSLCMSAFELRSTLPCDQSLWEADSAESWQQIRQTKTSSPLFLSCLKMYLHPGAATVPKNLNTLSRSLLLHGLMSIAWDMQRRDQTALGAIDTNSLGNWQARLATSYNAWHADFTSFCTTYLSNLPSPTHPLGKEFTTFRAAVLALYHSAHILLHTPFLDLQIYAGSRHILGRPVTRQDYIRSQKCVKKWVQENVVEASTAVWHAAALVQKGVEVLDAPEGSGSGSGSSDLAGGRLWHLPWSVYLGTLVVWGVWYAKPTSPSFSSSHSKIGDLGFEDEDEIIWDPAAEMNVLLDTILKGDAQRLLDGGAISGGVGKRGTNGLAAVVSKCLSKVRWAVVHDGMMVLRGLVCWRLVGGGGMG
ncbi:fungal-specific transcription factor domain-containing protein [Lophiotrema nucula]|uniref:Fungal-specific transcription factor domain-containing protein n=1 Tax=Lophiotrema nucula TaxID=690887 RepID=A0A6A5YTB6_9PLEO|nr:fungal-specific transcription factor domain-containing protein [Lophiotrema nucula]